jgi:hypothetical protein
MDDGFDMDYDETVDDPQKTLTRNPDDLSAIRDNTIENNMEAIRDDLRDKGIPDGEEMENLIDQQRQEAISEFNRDAFGSDDFAPAQDSLDDAAVMPDNGEDLNSGEAEEITDDVNSDDIGEDLNEVPADEITDEPQELNEQDILDDLGGEGDNDSREIAKAENIREWMGDINPNYDPFDESSAYDNNCGSCAFAVEQRLNGNADIVASAENIPTNAEMDAVSGMEQTSMNPQEIEEYLISQGPGSHGIVGVEWSGADYGHWFNAYYDGEKVMAIDGQNNKIMDWPPYSDEVSAWDFSVKKRSDK